MTAEPLLGPEQESGRRLMRTAVRLRARGTPVTLAELASAAGVDVDHLRGPLASLRPRLPDLHAFIIACRTSRR
jgi:hypothetical protein